MRALKILSDKIFPALFWLCIMMAFDSPDVCIASLFSAAVHEGGHILMAKIIKRREISIPRATLTGLKIDTGRLLSYKEEIFIAAGGPSVNLAFFLFSIPFSRLSEHLALYGYVNLFTAITNLLPIRGLDGGRIVHAALSSYGGAHVADRVISALTLIFSATFTFISLSLLTLSGEGWWIFSFFFAVLLGEILKRH